MPKAGSDRALPLQGLFPLAKPSGPPSMRIIDAITPLLVESRLFDDPDKTRQPAAPAKKKKNYTHMGLKIGQGGTLDPLADGVLVIGVNRGTKHLNRFLECTKEYESIGLLGASTTTMDADGPILATAPFEHITREDIEGVLDRFRGDIVQVPPIFSALKMDGKPLYEYARESIPLPRPIPSRPCNVSIELVDFTPASKVEGDGGHNYRWPTQTLSTDEKAVFQRLTEMVHAAQTSGTSQEAEPLVPDLKAEDVSETSPRGLRPATFTVRMTVTSGTYVRSIVNDIGLALGCVAHVVKLTRTRQGEFILGSGVEEDRSADETYGVKDELSAEEKAANESNDPASKVGDDTDKPGPDTTCIPWSIFSRAIEERNQVLEEEKREREELLASGTSAEEIDGRVGREAILAKRRSGPLKQWEEEVLRTFHSVPVPAPGSHGHKPYGRR